jgi:S1-C subfamily serine protease
MNRLMAPVVSGIVLAGIVLGAAACSSKEGAPATSQASSAATTTTTTVPSQQGTAAAGSNATSTATPAPIQTAVRSTTELSVEDVVKLADPSIVRIQTTIGVGTGFIVSTDGYLVTNNHVVAGRNGQPEATVQVTLSDGTNMTGKVVGADARSDIAIVKLDRSEPFSALKLGKLDDVAVGEDVVAIGYALDLKAGEGASYSVTRGIVSAKNRGISEGSVASGAIQTDAAINHGNSGGPLLNLQGEVIGVNTSLAPDPTNPGQVAAGIGFAVGSDTVQAVYDDIHSTGAVSRGYLGIQGFEALRPAEARDLGIPDTTRGVFLAAADAVAPSSPADQGGLRSGDVITKIDGVDIRTESDLTVQMIREAPNKTVEVDIYRGGQQQALQITLGTPPAQ